MLVASITVHLLLLLVISLIPSPEEEPEEATKTVITVFVEEEEQPEVKADLEKVIMPELETSEVEVDIDVSESEPVVEELVDLSSFDDDTEDSASDDDLSELMGFGDGGDGMDAFDGAADAIMSISTPGSFSNAAGKASSYSNRSGSNKKRALAKHGADAKTESAVNKALEWLANQQERDGSWIADKHEAHLGDQQKLSVRAVSTACAILPFLGAGHNEIAGKYKHNVRKAVAFINKTMKDKKLQQRPIMFNNYGSAIVLTALAESSIFGSSATTKKNADIIANHFVESYDKRPGEGWGYTAAGDDFSVSGWIILGLKSGESAGLKCLKSKKYASLKKSYKKWVHGVMTDPKSGLGYYRSPKDKKHGGARTSMSWVGMFQKQALNFPASDPFLKKASKVLVETVKKGKIIGGEKLGDAYKIYYGTLASFQQQGATWNAWNLAMKKSLVKSQREGDPSELGGSWDPTPGHFGEKAGRLFTTSMLALCMEIYYRYDIMN